MHEKIVGVPVKILGYKKIVLLSKSEMESPKTSEEILNTFFLCMCLFLSLCFSAVNNIWLDPT